MNLKQIKDYCDLYGWTITVKQLKKQFNLVSFAEKSQPKSGSLTLSTNYLNENNDTIINRAILHRNGEITLVTNQGWLRFLK